MRSTVHLAPLGGMWPVQPRRGRPVPPALVRVGTVDDDGSAGAAGPTSLRVRVSVRVSSADTTSLADGEILRRRWPRQKTRVRVRVNAARSQTEKPTEVFSFESHSSLVNL